MGFFKRIFKIARAALPVAALAAPFLLPAIAPATAASLGLGGTGIGASLLTGVKTAASVASLTGALGGSKKPQQIAYSAAAGGSVPKAPMAGDVAVQDAQAAQLEELKKQRGRAATIKTRSIGVIGDDTGPAAGGLATKTLLG